MVWPLSYRPLFYKAVYFCMCLCVDKRTYVLYTGYRFDNRTVWRDGILEALYCVPSLPWYNTIQEQKDDYKYTHQPHDTGYKYLLSSKRVFTQLLRSFVKVFFPIFRNVSLTLFTD